MYTAASLYRENDDVSLESLMEMLDGDTDISIEDFQKVSGAIDELHVQYATLETALNVYRAGSASADVLRFAMCSAEAALCGQTVSIESFDNSQVSEEGATELLGKIGAAIKAGFAKFGKMLAGIGDLFKSDAKLLAEQIDRLEKAWGKGKPLRAEPMAGSKYLPAMTSGEALKGLKEPIKFSDIRTSYQASAQLCSNIVGAADGGGQRWIDLVEEMFGKFQEDPEFGKRVWRSLVEHIDDTNMGSKVLLDNVPYVVDVKETATNYAEFLTMPIPGGHRIRYVPLSPLKIERNASPVPNDDYQVAPRTAKGIEGTIGNAKDELEWILKVVPSKLKHYEKVCKHIGDWAINLYMRGGEDGQYVYAVYSATVKMITENLAVANALMKNSAKALRQDVQWCIDSIDVTEA